MVSRVSWVWSYLHANTWVRPCFRGHLCQLSRFNVTRHCTPISTEAYLVGNHILPINRLSTSLKLLFSTFGIHLKHESTQTVTVRVTPWTSPNENRTKLLFSYFIVMRRYVGLFCPEIGRSNYILLKTHPYRDRRCGSPISVKAKCNKLLLIKLIQNTIKTHVPESSRFIGHKFLFLIFLKQSFHNFLAF